MLYQKHRGPPVSKSKNLQRECVIRVFNNPAITWTLTVILLLSGSYHFLQAAKPHQFTDRINNGLHALMNILMAAMLWNLASSTLLAQIAVLAGAALWFIIQAVARPEFKTLCAGHQGRLRCLYHSFSMASAAVMLAMMGQVTAGNVPATGMVMSHAHHSLASAAPSAATVTFDHSLGLAILLTVAFGAAMVVFVLLLLRRRVANAALRNAAASRLSVRAEYGLEAFGAAAMAMMFATMS